MNDDQKKTTQHAKGQVKNTVSALFDFLSSPNTKRWVEDNIAEPLDKLEEKAIEVKGEVVPNNMEAPSHPRCACGKASSHESGWCGDEKCKSFAPITSNTPASHSPFCGHCGSSKLTPFCPKCGKKT